MASTKSDKSELRKQLRRQRRDLSAQQQQLAATALLQSVLKLPAWCKAKCIATYWASDGEIATTALHTLARSQNKQLALPRITAHGTLELALWRSGDRLLTNRYHIPEPAPSSPCWPLSQLDIIFMPLVAWDIHGGRLGMGGGFYDRALAATKQPLLVGLAHACQQVTSVPLEKWDIRLDYIATDSALHRCTTTPTAP